MKIQCTESEKKAVINALVESAWCFGGTDCELGCYDCIEASIEWEIKDSEQK